MAVEASHITLFSPPNMEMIYQGNGSRCDDRLQTVYGSTTEKLLPAYDCRQMDAFPASGLTSALPISRKRSRDLSSIDPVPFSLPNVNPNGYQFGEFTFLGVDISSQIYQQQMEIDRIIAYHTENVRSEIEQLRKQNNRRLISALQEAITNRLKTKEEEYLKIGRLNLSLEEKVKSMSIENQILKELVQTNEATANALRNKLQQVLAQVQLQQQQQQQHHFDFAENAAKATVSVDDCESHCGSNFEEDHRESEGERKVNDENEECRYGRMNRRCRKCGKEESCVLLLPCRHLCVCTFCVSSVSVCPVCNSTKSTGVHVNMSMSSS